MTDNFLLSLIVGCEIGFWVFLLAGLTARYLFKWSILSAALLFCVPLVDFVLLGATVIDLHKGSTATFAHGLAAAYLGFTVAFGAMTIGWVDQRFAHRLAGGETPSRPPTFGRGLLRYELKLWGRCVLAAVITMALVFVAIAWVDNEEKTKDLELWLELPLGTVAMWFLFGPLWGLLFSWSPRVTNGPRDPS
jgi:hypothetical protein